MKILTIQSHRLKVGGLQVGQQKSVALRVPCAISHMHRGRVVDARPGVRELVGHFRNNVPFRVQWPIPSETVVK